MKEYLFNFISILWNSPAAPLLFVLASAAVCLAGPVTLFLTVGGVVFGFWGGLALNLLSTLLGASCAFWIARRLGRASFEKRFAKYMKFLSGDEAATLEFESVLLLRFIGIPPFFILNYLLGLTPVSWKIFAGATLAGVLPWTLFVTYFSDLLWHAFRAGGWAGFHQVLSERARPLVWVLAVFSASFVLVKLLKMRKKRAQGAIEKD